MLRLSTTVVTSPVLCPSASSVHLRTLRLLRFRVRAFAAAASSPSARSLRLLEWGKVCDAVAFFAGTAHGREATKKQLWEVEDVSYEQSRRLLQETEAVVWLLDNAGGAMDFSGLDTVAVESAIQCVSGGAVVKGLEAMAVAVLMLFVESLQINIKAATKQDEDSHNRLLPLTEMVLDVVINKSLVKGIQDIVDDDGSVKDTASTELRRYRERVQVLESRIRTDDKHQPPGVRFAIEAESCRAGSARIENNLLATQISIGWAMHHPGIDAVLQVAVASGG